MTSRTFSILGRLAGGIAATFLVLGCDGDGGGGSGAGSSQDACVAGLFTGEGAYLACLQSECRPALDELETDCAGYFACACPGGPYDPSAARSSSCLQLAQSPSCQSAFVRASCSACDGTSTSSSGAGGSGGVGTSSGAGNGSGTSSGTGSSSGDPGGGSSGSDVDAGSSGGSGSGSGSSSGSDCNVTCAPNTSCTSDGACADGAEIQSCVSIDSCCNDSCYYTLGGEPITCASCGTDDLEACVSQLYEGCH